MLVYDNQGETLDRYTVFHPDGSVYAMCSTGQSIDLYVGTSSEIPRGPHLGIQLTEIPNHIIQRLKLRYESIS